MSRSFLYVGIFLCVASLLGCGLAKPKRVAVKNLVVKASDLGSAPAYAGGASKSDPQKVVIKLRWSIDPKTFDPKVQSKRFRFPECGFALYRKEPGKTAFTKVGDFNLPTSEAELKKRISEISDKKLEGRLLTPSDDLTKESKNLLTAIEASQKGKKDDFPADPMGLLMMASLNPAMAQILGLYYADTVMRDNVLLFSADSKFATNLDNMSIPAGLIQAFKNNNLPLSKYPGVSIQKKGSRWLIIDKTGNKGGSSSVKIYSVKKSGDKKQMLNVYDNTYIYRIVGKWNWGSGCVSAPEDEAVISVQAYPDPPLVPPEWADKVFGISALRQVKKMHFNKPEQQVTHFWDDPMGKKKQAPPSFTPQEPVVELQWQKTGWDQYIGYHIDRMTIYGRYDDPRAKYSYPTRVNVFPRLLFDITGQAYRKCRSELDSMNISEDLRKKFKDMGISLSQKATVWVREKGTSWFINDIQKNIEQTYYIEQDEGKLKVHHLSPFLVLSSIKAITEMEEPERFLDTFKLRGGETYIYEIIAVDIFGRESKHSEHRHIELEPIGFPPVPPHRVGIESYDPDNNNALLSDPCPKKTPGSPQSWTWVSPADLGQKKGTMKLWVRLKWQWTKKQQERYKASYFNVYQETAPDAPKGQPVVTGLNIKEGHEVYQRSFLITTTHPATKQEMPAMYYYFFVTTVSKGINDDNDDKRDEDPKDLMDNDGDGQVDEDPYISESDLSIPVMAYVVDKVPPKMPPAPCTEDSEDSWVEINVDKTQDPDWEGKLAVHLDWSKFADQKLTDNDIDGYHLYRAIDVEKINPKDINYIRLNRELIEMPFYVDRIEARARNKFYYKLQGVDKAGNISLKSDASCPFQLPDKTPPDPPVIVAVSGGNEQITVKWEPSSSPDIAGYYVYHGASRQEVEKASQDKSKRLNKSAITAPQDSKFAFQDGPTLETGKDFYYIVEAVDKEGNRGFSLPAAGRAYDINPPAAPTNLAAKVKVSKPLIVEKENALIKVTRVTPSKVAPREEFLVDVRVKVKATRVEFVSVSEDPKDCLMLASGNPQQEWSDPSFLNQGAELNFDYELGVQSGATPGKCRIVGTIKVVEMGKAQTMDLTSQVEVVPSGTAKNSVELTWKLPEPDSRAAIWRCTGEACENNGTWRMIAPLRPEGAEKYEDTGVVIGRTYYYKIHAFDKIGNKGKFSGVLKVKVE